MKILKLKIMLHTWLQCRYEGSYNKLVMKYEYLLGIFLATINQQNEYDRSSESEAINLLKK